MALEYDVRDAARRPAAPRQPASRGAGPPSRGIAAPRGAAARDLSEAWRHRGEEANSFTGTPAVLTAAPPSRGGPPRGSTVERALACVRDAIGRQGGTRGIAPAAGEGLEFVPDPDVIHTSAGTEVVHLHQHHRGVPVFEAVRSVHFDPGRRREIVGDHVAIDPGAGPAPAISAADAVMAAARHLAAAGGAAAPDGTPLAVSSYAPRMIVSFPLPSRPSVLAKRPFADPVTAHLTWLPCGGGETCLGWLVSLALPAGAEHYDLIVGAAEPRAGEVLFCKGSFRTARGLASVFRHNPGDPGGRVEFELPLPREAYPPLAAAPAAEGFGRPWVSDDRTRGNNAVAFAGNRKKATLAGERGGGRVEFTPAEPEGKDQRLLNAFYFCNYLHDFFALLGFGEAEGNFQRKNFSGVPGDRDELEIRVFDRPVAGTGRMRSRRDGRPGELHLGPREGRHAALDADLVFHEYVHGVTLRLAGGRLNFEPLSHPESRALGEGYSDYFALTIQSHQLGEEKTVFGAWLGDDATAGLRRHAYGEDFPLSYGDLTAAENQEPHAGGEIWCAALMRMNRRIGEALADPARGHEIGWQLVLDSLKLLPVGADQPGFLDARDAVTRALTDLAAAGSLDAQEHAAIETAVLEAFARTGMGPGAAGRGAHFSGIVADFTGAGIDPADGGEGPNDPPGGTP